MSTVDFKSLLSTPADEFKPPVPLPAGTYFGMVKSFSFGESKEKKTPFVEFTLSISHAGEDIDQKDLEGMDLSKKVMKSTFYLTQDSTYRLKEFTDSCNIPSAGRSLAEIIQDTPNQPILIEVEQQMNTKEPTQPPRNNVKNIKGQP